MRKMKPHALLRCSWTFAVLAVLASQARADLVDGGFESPPVSSGTYMDFTGGQTIGSAWTVQGNDVLLINTNYTEPGVSFNAHGGLNALDLTGLGNTGTTDGVSQSLTTTVGTVYNVTFWIGRADDSGSSGLGKYTGPASVGLSIGGGGFTEYTNSSVTANQVNWMQFTASFTATTTMTSFTFLNDVPPSANTNYVGLDDVSVTPASTAAPEPSTLVLGGIGVLLASWGKFRRRKDGDGSKELT